MHSLELPKKSISLIILTYNRYAMTDLCLRGVEAYSDFSLFKEVIVVDCHSTDGTERLIQSIPWIDHIVKVPYGSVQESMLAGLEIATGEFVIKLDNDMLVSDRWNHLLFQALLAGKQAHRIDIVGFAQTINVKGRRISPLEQQLHPKLPLQGCSHCLFPVSYIGGNFICHRDVFSNFREHQGGDPQYGGWWTYHRSHYEDHIAYIWPRLGIVDMGLLGNPNYMLTDSRIQEPLFQEAIERCGINSWHVALPESNRSPMVKDYLNKGWMRA